jgi:hypothetical protein
MLVYLIAGDLPAWAMAGILAGVLALLVAVETVALRRSRAA